MVANVQDKHVELDKKKNSSGGSRGADPLLPAQCALLVCSSSSTYSCMKSTDLSK